jgi:hypothetical protein
MIKRFETAQTVASNAAEMNGQYRKSSLGATRPRKNVIVVETTTKPHALRVANKSANVAHATAMREAQIRNIAESPDVDDIATRCEIEKMEAAVQ